MRDVRACSVSDVPIADQRRAEPKDAEKPETDDRDGTSESVHGQRETCGSTENHGEDIQSAEPAMDRYRSHSKLAVDLQCADGKRETAAQEMKQRRDRA